MEKLLSSGADQLIYVYEYVGPVGALLLVISVFSTALIVFKLAGFLFAGLGRTQRIEQALSVMESDGLEASVMALGQSAHPIADMIRTGARLAQENQSRQRIESEVRAVAIKRLARLSRYNSALEMIGLIAPLLGLLGTILGMIAAFQALQSSGAQADPAVLAGGIWEALLTTAIGLVVAIPAIITFNLVESRLDRLRQQSATMVDQFFARLGPHLQ